MENKLYGQKSSSQPENESMKTSKRLFDAFFGVLLCVTLLPVIIAIAGVLFFIYQKNPFYTQKRSVSLESKIFTILKFRTMFSEDTVGGDPREFILKKNNQIIAPFCAWLRKTGLDELPQLINVVKGDMSFIGPRPLSLTDLKTLREYYPQEYAIRSGLRLKPGVSGYWQIFGDRTLGVKNLVEMDAEYASKMSFAFDCYLVWKTIPVMIMAEHSDAVLGGREVNERISKTENARAVATEKYTVKLGTEV